MTSDEDKNESSERDGGIGDLASRLIRVGAEAVSIGAEKLREKGSDLNPKEFVSGAASFTAKGKDELVTLVAGEVRGYLNKLKVGEEIRSLITDHSLEVSASIRFKPVPKDNDGEGESGSAAENREDPTKADD
jgi:hypothetical protein